MKRKLLSIALIMLMVLGLGCVGVSAEESFTLTVNNVSVTAENAEDVFGDGTVSFDSSTCTLTLSDAHICKKESEDSPKNAVISAEGMDLTIVLKGENTLTMDNSALSYSNVIIVEEGTLKIKGEENSKLTINTGDAVNSVCGISVTGAYTTDTYGLNLEDAEIAINCGKADTSTGIFCDGRLLVSGGSLEIETAEANDVRGICTNPLLYYEEAPESESFTAGHSTFTNGAKVNITAEKAELSSYGISSGGDITIDGAKIDTVVSAGHGDAEDSTSDKVFPEGTVYAISACGNLIFRSCEVTVFAKNGGGNIVNASTREDIDQATGETAKTRGNIEIHEGADIYIKTADSDYNRFAMSSSYDITVYAGKLTIEMGELTGNFVVRRMYGMYADHIARFNGGITTISMPERTEEYDDFSCVSSWHGGIFISDDVVITGRNGEFFGGVGACVQIDPEIPVVFKHKDLITFDLGDVNRDGEINIKDATTIQKVIASLLTFDLEQKHLADFNGDKAVNVRDATAIQKKLAGLI